MKIELNNNKIFYKNGSSVQEIHPFWLRERANGEKYLDKKTQQRLFDPTSLNVEIAIKSARINNDLLEIDFNDGVNSKLNIEKIAEEFSLGVANPKNIKIVGEDITKINWNYSSNENTLASKGQKFIYWGPLKPLEKILLRSKISPWAFFASDLYHNKYWLRFIGKRRIRKAMKTRWGQLFQKY